MKRVLYTELGTGLGAAACYPDLARETATVVETEGRKVVDTTYSLVTGGGGEASRYVLRVFVSRFFNPGLNFPITIVLKNNIGSFNICIHTEILEVRVQPVNRPLYYFGWN